jgi:hypothetical protein
MITLDIKRIPVQGFLIGKREERFCGANFALMNEKSQIVSKMGRVAFIATPRNRAKSHEFILKFIL